MSTRSRTSLVAAAVAAASVVVGTASGGQVAAAPATYLADTLSDNPADGYTVREAIADANANPGADIVGFADGLAGTVTLQSGQLDITDHLTLRGSATDDIVISAAGSSRVLFSFTPGVDLTVEHLELTNGDAAFFGGAVAVYQGNDLVLDHVTISNSASDEHGGGIGIGEATGSIQITNSRIVGNTAADNGGGLSIFGHDAGGSVTIDDTVLHDNTTTSGSGGGAHVLASTESFIANRVTVSSNESVAGDSGGLHVRAGFVDVDAIDVVDNVAFDDNGGADLRSSTANVNIASSSFVGNQAHEVGGVNAISASFMNSTGNTVTGNRAEGIAGMRLSAAGGIRVRSSHFDDNVATVAGGALVLLDAPDVAVADTTIISNEAPEIAGLGLLNVADALIERSTIANNTATTGDGGGVYADGSAPDALRVNLSTISGNEAAGHGGGIFAESVDLTIDASTIVGNTAGGSGGGILQSGTSALAVDHTVIADNAAATFPDVTGPLDVNWSMITDTVGVPFGMIGDNLPPADPQLGPLGDHGGPTLTHLPASTSPLVDAGNPGALFGEPDQRHFPRAVGVVDIGAVERSTAAQSIWVPVTPARVVDTRPGHVTIDGEDQSAGAFAAGEERRVRIAGRAGIPADARGVIANVTAVQASSNGYVTVHPCVSPRPVTASLNFTAGVNLGNEVIIGLDADDLCIYSSSATGVTVDVVGYIPAMSPYQTVEPARFLDTRATGQTIDGEFEAIDAPGAGQFVKVDISGRSPLPIGVDEAVMYVAAIGAEANGFVTIWDCGDEMPLASSLNFVAGVNRGNEVITALNHDGQVCVFTSSDVDLSLDVVGFVAPVASNFTPLDDPSRLLDTRAIGETIDGEFAGGGANDASDVLELDVAGRAGIPASAATVTMNLTAVQPQQGGYVTAFPCGGDEPNTASVNYVAGINGGNEIVASLDDQGRVCLFTSSAVHLTVDATGFTSV